MKNCFIFFSILIIGCKSKSTSVDIFFQKLDKTLSKSEKSQIRKCPDIGCLVMFVQSNASKRFTDAYRVRVADIDRFLVDSFKINIPYDRHRALFLAYQKKLNRIAVDFIEIKNEIIRYDKLQDSIYANKYRLEIKMLSDIAKYNFNRFHIGDALNMLLPLGWDGNTKVVYYFTELNKNKFKDTLFVKCILLKKLRNGVKDWNLLTMNIIFWLEF